MGDVDEKGPELNFEQMADGEGEQGDGESEGSEDEGFGGACEDDAKVLGLVAREAPEGADDAESGQEESEEGGDGTSESRPRRRSRWVRAAARRAAFNASWWRIEGWTPGAGQRFPLVSA